MGPLGCTETSETTNLRYVTNVPEKQRSQWKISYYQPFDYWEVWTDYNVGYFVITIAIPHLAA